MWRSLLSLPWSCLPLLANDAQVEAEAKFADARARMVTEQLASPARGIQDFTVLEAMRVVRRHEFVPEKSRDLAYADRPLSIGHGQTISQPYVVAFMTEQLAPGHTDRVLEIGTGSGYQAAVLSRLVADVYSSKSSLRWPKAPRKSCNASDTETCTRAPATVILDGWSRRLSTRSLLPAHRQNPPAPDRTTQGRWAHDHSRRLVWATRTRAPPQTRGPVRTGEGHGRALRPHDRNCAGKDAPVTATAAPQKPADRRSREGRR